MNPDSVKSSPCPSITVYRSFQDFVNREVIDPLLQAKEYPPNYDTKAFAKDFSGHIQMSDIEGYYRTFEPSLLVSLIQNYATVTKLRDLKVGDRILFHGSEHTVVAKSDTFYVPKEASILLSLLLLDEVYPSTYTLHADFKVRTL